VTDVDVDALLDVLSKTARDLQRMESVSSEALARFNPQSEA
jgi:hypothetical protein